MGKIEPPAPKTNLITNGDFSAFTDGNPDGWSPYKDVKTAQVSGFGGASHAVKIKRQVSGASSASAIYHTLQSHPLTLGEAWGFSIDVLHDDINGLGMFLCLHARGGTPAITMRYSNGRLMRYHDFSSQTEVFPTANPIASKTPYRMEITSSSGVLQHELALTDLKTSEEVGRTTINELTQDFFVLSDQFTYVEIRAQSSHDYAVTNVSMIR